MKDTIRAQKLVLELQARFPGRFLEDGKKRQITTAFYRFLSVDGDSDGRRECLDLAAATVTSRRATPDSIVSAAQAILDWEPVAKQPSKKAPAKRHSTGRNKSTRGK